MSIAQLIAEGEINWSPVLNMTPDEQNAEVTALISTLNALYADVEFRAAIFDPLTAESPLNIFYKPNTASAIRNGREITIDSEFHNDVYYLDASGKSHQFSAERVLANVYWRTN